MASSCHGCGRPIRWVTTAPSKSNPRGGRMPLEPEPDEGGNVVVRAGLAYVLSKTITRRPGEALHMPHRARCPAAAGYPPRRRVG